VRVKVLDRVGDDRTLAVAVEGPEGERIKFEGSVPVKISPPPVN